MFARNERVETRKRKVAYIIPTFQMSFTPEEIQWMEELIIMVVRYEQLND